MLRRLVYVCLLCSLCACATSSRVKQGALWGGVAGAAVGAGGGWVLSDPNLRGTEAGPRHGDTQLDTGMSIATGAGIGLVVGAIVGAMVGHQRDDRIEKKTRNVEGDPAAEGEASTPPTQSEASAALAPAPQS